MNITNDIITAYIDSLYKSGNPQLMELRQFAEDKHIPIILKETESLLLNILRLGGRIFRLLFRRRLRLSRNDHRIR